MQKIKNPAVLLRIRGAVGDSSLRDLLIGRVTAAVDLDEAEALLAGDLDDDGRSSLLFSTPRGVFGLKPDWDSERWDALCARLALDDPSVGCGRRRLGPSAIPQCAAGCYRRQRTTPCDSPQSPKG